jgi:hypothetical protein
MPRIITLFIMTATANAVIFDAIRWQLSASERVRTMSAGQRRTLENIAADAVRQPVPRYLRAVE